MIGAGGEKLENVTVEGILPGNVGVVVECETDNKARTMMTLRHVLKEAGGTATPSAYLFEKKGVVVFESQPGKGLDALLDIALDAGATDIEVKTLRMNSELSSMSCRTRNLE